MNAAEVTFLSVYFMMAAGSAIACILFGFLLLHVSRNRVHIFFPVMLFLMTFMGITDAALSGRSLDLNLLSLEAASESGTRLPSKVMLAFLIGLSIVVVVANIFDRSRKIVGSPSLLWGLLTFYVSCALVPAAFGYEPHFIIALVYTPVVFYALFTSAPNDPGRLVLFAKLSMASIAGLSLIAIFVIPPVVLESGYRGLVPGLDKRLWGLASHANVLGPVALTLLILEWAEPFRTRVIHYGVLAMALATILLTQSKTSILAGIVAFGVIFVYRLNAGIGASLGSGTQQQRSNKFLLAAAGLFLVVVTLAFVAYLLAGDMLPARLNFLDRVAVENLQTGSGRQPIWNAAIVEGWRSPYFGYGLQIWEREFRISRALFTAFHAHNQVLQVFSLAGFFGLLGFTVYVAILAAASFRYAAATGGATLALFSMLLVRSITEVPLQISAPTSGDFLSHLAFVFYLVACGLRARVMPTQAGVVRGTKAIPSNLSVALL